MTRGARDLFLTTAVLLAITLPASAGVYMASGRDGLLFVKFHSAGRSLSGNVQLVKADDLTADGTVVRIYRVFGSIEGKALTLDTPGSFASGTPVYGVLHGGNLVLRFPTESGRIEKVVLYQASEAKWNQTLGAFRARRKVVAAAVREQRRRADLEARLAEARQERESARQELDLCRDQLRAQEEQLKEVETALQGAQAKLNQANRQMLAADRYRALGQEIVTAARELQDAVSLSTYGVPLAFLSEAKAAMHEAGAAVEAAAASTGSDQEPALTRLVTFKEKLVAMKPALGKLSKEAAIRNERNFDPSRPLGAYDAYGEARYREERAIRSEVESLTWSVGSVGQGASEEVRRAERGVRSAEEAVKEIRAEIEDQRQKSQDLESRIAASEEVMHQCQRGLAPVPRPVAPVGRPNL